MTTHILAVAINGLERPHGVTPLTFHIGWRVTRSDGPIPETVRVSVRNDHGVGEVWTSDPAPLVDGGLEYQGPPLSAMTDYVVEISDGDLRAVIADLAFNSGKLHQPWNAGWIGRATETFRAARAIELSDLRPTSLFDRTRSWRTVYNSPVAQIRKTFTVRGELTSARLVISARGLYNAHINGVMVGDEELAPGWTNYDDRVPYQNHDITNALEVGKNVVTVELADGWWSGGLSYDTRIPAQHYGSKPSLIAEAHLTYRDGTREVIATDGTWLECPGEVRYADILMGELHDFTCATPGWRTLDFVEGTEWEPVALYGSDTAVLEPSDREPVRVIRSIDPLSTREVDGKLLVDFGQNFAGRVRLRLRSVSPGDAVVIRHGEVLDAGGRLYTENLRSAEATDIVIASGVDGLDEVFQPRFTFHGFRYIEIDGLAEPPREGDLVAEVLSTDLRPLLTLETGHPLVNKIFSNIEWGLRSNFVSVPTDCPQRDERLGWSADVQVFAPTASYLVDSTEFLKSWLVDFARSQGADGRLPDVAPKPPKSENFDRAAPAWGDAITILPWHLYQQTGDEGILRQFYPHMRRWVDYVISANPDGIWENLRGNDYGDWLSVDEFTSKELVATSYLARSAEITARVSRVLGYLDDEARFLAAAATVKAAYLDRFVVDDRLRDETQTGYALALHFALVPDELRQSFGGRLATLIESRGHRLTTGFLGISALAPALSSVGRSDLAFDLLLQTDFPSWGYSIARGATTIWERWDAWTEEMGFQSSEMNSFNHYSLGSIGAWMAAHMAGIRQEAGSVGFHSILIAPEIDERVGRVDATYDSPVGEIRSAWAVENGSATLNVRIPPGQSARVIFGSVDQQIDSGEHSWTIDYSEAAPATMEMTQ